MSEITSMPVAQSVPVTETAPSHVPVAGLPVSSGGCGKCENCSCDADREKRGGHSHQAGVEKE